MIARGRASRTGLLLRSRLWSALARPWDLRQVGTALAIIVLVDLALGYLQIPGLVDARRTTRSPVASGPSRLTEAVLDESAHALTALVLFKATGSGRADALLTLAGGVLIDVDHVPMELGLNVITRGTNRPYSHSLLMIGGVVILAGLVRSRFRRPMLAVAFGIATHLLRDLATGGVPLYWPFLMRRETIAYGFYAVALLAGGAVAVWNGWDRGGGGRDSDCDNGRPRRIEHDVGADFRPARGCSLAGVRL